MASESPDTTDRLAEIREALADWIEHDDCDALLASDAVLFELLNELETKRAEVSSLRVRLDTAEGQIAKIRARHRLDDELACGNGEHTNRAVVCPECADVCAGCGDHWPCDDAKDLGADDV